MLTSVLQIAATQVEMDNPKVLLNEVNRYLKHFIGLLSKYVSTEKTQGAQSDCLSALETFCLDESHFLPIVAKIIHILYDKEIVSDEAVFKWFKNSNSKVKDKAKPFVEWLEEDEDEEESDED